MEKVVILGAGGRDFHNFNTFFRDNPSYKVIAFTAAQIPYIENRVYPKELAGALYPDGIPVYPEERLPELITENNVTQAVFSYSDVSYEEVMHRASIALSKGADFLFLGPDKTMINSRVPVISVCAVRTGCGKSVITRKLAAIIKDMGFRVSVIRHPMAYNSFEPALRLSTIDDINRQASTIEEREEFEHLIAEGITVYAGVDYQKVVKSAEAESDMLIWDGGNNDFSFIRPDMEIVLLDALRPGHEICYYPGEVNLRRGNLLIITKVNEAKEGALKMIRKNITTINPRAQVIEAPSVVSIDNPDMIKDKRVLVVEDGPSITHGGIPYGAGASASLGLASELIDPRPYAAGSIKDVYERFPHIGRALPAMGYSKKQISELEETINNSECDVVVVATPADLTKIIRINKSTVRVSYDLDIGLTNIAEAFIKEYIKNERC